MSLKCEPTITRSHNLVCVFSLWYTPGLRVSEQTASLGGVPREQKMLKGHLPRVIYHQVYEYTNIRVSEQTASPPNTVP